KGGCGEDSPPHKSTHVFISVHAPRRIPTQMSTRHAASVRHKLRPQPFARECWPDSSGRARRPTPQMILSGIHPVSEALRAGSALERILIAQGAGGPRMQEVIDLARRAGVPVRFEPRAALERLAGSSAHQGVIALGAARKYAEIDAVAESDLLVVLDGV